jgi:hypothetical protein
VWPCRKRSSRWVRSYPDRTDRGDGHRRRYRDRCDPHSSDCRRGVDRSATPGNRDRCG